MAKPFLQCHRRFKNGKDHCYWSIAEKVRTRRGWVQRHLLYLGEINDSQKAAWTKTVDVFDAPRQQTQELALYPADRAIPEHAAEYGVAAQVSSRCDGRASGAPAGWAASCGINSIWTSSGRSDCPTPARELAGAMCWRP